MILVPLIALAALLIAVLGLGAPARAEVIVPLFIAPPADAYQDIGVIGLTGTTGAGAWIARAVFAIVRTAMFALLAGLAVRRASGGAAEIASARKSTAGRWKTFAALGAASFGFALLVSQQASLDPGRDAAIAATALTTAMLVIPGAFVSAAALGTGFWRSLGRGLGFPRPIGHVGLVIGYAAGLNALYRLASFGEVQRPRALPIALYAAVAALLTAAFTAALAGRYLFLRGENTPEEAAQAPV